MANDVRRALGRRLRELRLQQELSQEELATRASLHRNYVGRVERAEADVSVTALTQLTSALGVSLAEFFAAYQTVTTRGDRHPPVAQKTRRRR